jgi:integrase
MKQSLKLIHNELSLNEPLVNAKQIFDSLDITQATRDDYKSRIGLFLDFVKGGKISTDAFLIYKRYLAARTDFTISTKNKYLACSRVFLKELNRKGILPMDITQNIKCFTQDKKHKKDGLTDTEIRTLAEKLNLTPKNTRIKAIISLLALQGLRQVEIIRLDATDIDFVAKKAFILGKGRDDKEAIDLHPETIKALKSYMDTNSIKSGALFTSYSNNSQNRRLTTRGLRGLVKQILVSLEISKTTHGFRHYFTTTLVKQFKGNLLEVSAYTRHKSLEMLQVYYDRVKKEEDLPKYYNAFKGVSF